jgi:hypothetical protein
MISGSFNFLGSSVPVHNCNGIDLFSLILNRSKNGIYYHGYEANLGIGKRIVQ